MCADELLPTPKIITFLLKWNFKTEKSERESKLTPYQEQEYLTGLVCLGY